MARVASKVAEGYNFESALATVLELVDVVLEAKCGGGGGGFDGGSGGGGGGGLRKVDEEGASGGRAHKREMQQLKRQLERSVAASKKGKVVAASAAAAAAVYSRNPSGPICGDFNSLKGCRRAGCSYLHQCRVLGCGQDHPASQHDVIMAQRNVPPRRP
ncbi:hypothetical protein T492DRAFT_418273 [Pavlovales sp. CCMP2436]|nr:hypothetical protein T492DRAFT_418273 [Pavlovales sp. CCMP2436]